MAEQSDGLAVGCKVDVIYHEEFNQHFPGEPHHFVGTLAHKDGNELRLKALVVDFGEEPGLPACVRACVRPCVHVPLPSLSLIHI